MRFNGWLPVPPEAGWVVAFLGVASAVLGVAFAFGQHDLKRLLAYHSVENIGIILIELGFALVAMGQGNATWGRLALHSIHGLSNHEARIQSGLFHLPTSWPHAR